MKTHRQLKAYRKYFIDVYYGLKMQDVAELLLETLSSNRKY